MLEVGLSGQMFDDVKIWDHIEAASRFGYKCVELRSTHVNPRLSVDEKKKILSTIQDKGLYTSCLSCFVGNYGLLSDEDCEKAFEELKRYVDLACYFDSKMIRIWPAWQESSSAPQAVWEKAARWMKKSAKYAKEFNRQLVIEMHHGTLCDTALSSIKLLEMIGENNVGVTLDPVNLYQVPTDYGEEAIKALNKHLFNVHIKDIVELKTDDFPYNFAYSYYAKHIGRFTKVVPPQSLQKERYYCHREINEGGVDWSHVLKSLITHGYKGKLIVESVSETNIMMSSGMKLAEASYKHISDLFDVLSGNNK